MRTYEADQLLTETATSAGTPDRRARDLLEVLRRVVPFDGAFVAFADPPGDGYHFLTTVDLDASTVDFLAGPQVARDIEATGTHPGRAAGEPVGPALPGRGPAHLGRVPDPGGHPLHG